MSESSEIIVHAFDLAFHDKIGPNGRSIIHLWCLDRESKPHLLRVMDFPVFVRVQLPSYVMGVQQKWTQESVDSLFMQICRRLRDQAPFMWTLQYQKKLYHGYLAPEQPFPLVFFKNLEDMRNFVNKMKFPIQTIEWGSIECQVWEEDITVLRKLMTATDIQFCGWMRCKVQKVPEEYTVSTLANEYYGSWNDMFAIPAEECGTWVTRPKMLSFDLENFSHRNVVPKHDHPEDAIIMNSMVVHRLNDPKNERKRYCFILGNCAPLKENVLENLIIVAESSEAALIMRFVEIVQLEDPDIITGYNIQGWDIPAFNTRLTSIYGCSWPPLGRIKNKPSVMTSKTWESSGYGYNCINTLEMEGRLCIDMLPVIQHKPEKLRSYTLKNVALHYLKVGKHDVTPREMFDMHRQMRNSLTVLYALNEVSKREPEVVNDPYFVQAHKRASDDYNESLHMAERVIRYCVQDSEVVSDIFEKNLEWDGHLALARVAGVSIIELINNGQQRRCLSLIYHRATKMGFVLTRRTEPKLGYAGGHVGKPKPGVYDCVIFLDFASLYPSIMQAYNMCYTTLVPPELRGRIDPNRCHIIKFTQEEEEGGGVDEEDELLYETVKKRKTKKKNVATVTREYENWFLREPEGILPAEVRTLVEQRGLAKVLMAKAKKEGDEVGENIYNLRQLALKVTGNSVYGFTGVSGGKLPVKEVAMSVTAKGRELILDVNRRVEEEFGGEVIYNDTDSAVIVLHNEKNRKTINAVGQDLANKLNATMMKPLKLEVEKCGIIMLICPKKYELIYITKSGELGKQENGDYKMLSRGDVMAKREHCAFIKEWYHELLVCVMEQRPILEAIDIIIKYTLKLLNGEVPDEELYGIRGLAPHYESQNYPMNLFAQRLRNEGKSAVPGDRIEFLYVKNPPVAPSHHVGWKMYTPDEIKDAEEKGAPLQIDYPFYLERAFKNHINQIFGIGYKSQLEQLSHIGYLPNKAHKVRKLEEICDIFYFLERDGYRNYIPKFRDLVADAIKPKMIEFNFGESSSNVSGNAEFSFD